MSWRAGLFVVICTTLVSCSAGGLRATTFKPYVLNPQSNESPYIAVYEASSGCSGVAVGPRVLLTAAHCVPDRWAELPKKFGRKKIEGHCSCHPDYFEGDGSGWGCRDDPCELSKEEDLALCIMNKDLPKQYLHEIDPDRQVDVDEIVLFAGFGCVYLDKCSNGSPVPGRGNPSHGYSQIVDIPSPSTWIIEGNLDADDSALCMGDSGGPVFVGPNWDKVVAINRDGCIPEEPDGDENLARSALTPLSARSTIDWMCDWLKEDSEKRQIYGLDDHCSP